MPTKTNSSPAAAEFVTPWEGPCQRRPDPRRRPPSSFRTRQLTAADTWVTLVQITIGICLHLNQILSRAFYAMHDTITPLTMAVVTLIVNLIVELPLIFTPLKEAGMAVGTTVSFVVQVALMMWLLHRRLGSLGMKSIGIYIGKLAIATIVMAGVCLLVQKTPLFPHDHSKSTALLRLFILMGSGAIAYFGICILLGVGQLWHKSTEEVH
jgi:peptidoglycan biosynthesis protein MviN/MurJ (putative lipid II flippase)